MKYTISPRAGGYEGVLRLPAMEALAWYYEAAKADLRSAALSERQARYALIPHSEDASKLLVAIPVFPDEAAADEPVGVDYQDLCNPDGSLAQPT